MDAPLKLLHPIIEVVGAAMHEYGIAEIRHGGYCIHRTAESAEVPPNEATNSASLPFVKGGDGCFDCPIMTECDEVEGMPPCAKRSGVA